MTVLRDVCGVTFVVSERVTTLKPVVAVKTEEARRGVANWVGRARRFIINVIVIEQVRYRSGPR